MHLRGCPSHPLPWAPRALRPMHPHRRPLGKLTEHPNRSPGAPCPMRWVPLAPPRPPSPQQVPGCPSHAPLAVSQCVPCPEHPDGPPTLDTPISTSCVPGPGVPQQAPPAQTPLCPPPPALPLTLPLGPRWGPLPGGGYDSWVQSTRGCRGAVGTCLSPLRATAHPDGLRLPLVLCVHVGCHPRAPSHLGGPGAAAVTAPGTGCTVGAH